jgi:hypothetical protein
MLNEQTHFSNIMMFIAATNTQLHRSMGCSCSSCFYDLLRDYSSFLSCCQWFTISHIPCSLIQVSLKRHRWHRKVLKTKDPIVVSIGWRRFQTTPVYAIEDRNGRHRMLKYTPEHMHCFAMFWGPLAPPKSGVLAVQSLSSNKVHSVMSSHQSIDLVLNKRKNHDVSSD